MNIINIRLRQMRKSLLNLIKEENKILLEDSERIVKSGNILNAGKRKVNEFRNNR